jgi:hypothetical protein
MCEDQAATASARITELTTDGEGLLIDHAQAVKSVASSYVWHINHTRYHP